MNARRTAGEQFAALRGGVLDADGAHGFVVVPDRSSRARSASGMRAPHIAVKRSICARLVIGMMPGMIGTRMPRARARSTNAK